MGERITCEMPQPDKRLDAPGRYKNDVIPNTRKGGKFDESIVDCGRLNIDVVQFVAKNMSEF